MLNPLVRSVRRMFDWLVEHVRQQRDDGEPGARRPPHAYARALGAGERARRLAHDGVDRECRQAPGRCVNGDEGEVGDGRTWMQLLGRSRAWSQ